MKDSHAGAGRAIAIGMILVPIVFFASALVAPRFDSDEGTQLSVIAQHPNRWYWFALLTLVGSMLIVPAFIGIMSLLRERAPLAAYVGGTLSVLGALVSIGDSLEQLIIWQVGAHGADHAAMTALLTRLDGATGLETIFNVGGIAIVVGPAILAIGLIRTRIVPWWSAVCLPLAMIVNIVGFGAESRTIIAASGVILVGAFAPLAAALTGGEERRSAEGLALA
jgi:hypothetical protein